MSKYFSAWLPAAAAALVLVACAGTGGQKSETQNGKHKQTAKPAAGGHCRSIDAGRKPNEKGKNDAYLCSAAAALNSAEAKEVLNPNIAVSYGTPGGKTLVSRQVANAVGKSPEETCQRAFLNTVKRFESTATRTGKKSVRVTSYFNKNTLSGGEYECHIGTWNSRVVLKGSLH